MGAMDTATPTRRTLFGWAMFALVVIVATMLFGSLALMVLSAVAGAALIVSGVRARSWPRPVLIVVGSLLVLAPTLLLIDMATGNFVISVR